ncbi:MAG TPA: FAD-dependent oxidoreductase, partial [Streptomyces sp.]
MPEPIVIVGTGVAGATAALTLRAEGYDGDLVMIGDEPELPYRRPPLSKEVLTGAQSPARTLLRPAGSWAERGIEVRTGTEVTALDPARRTVTLDDGTRLPYHRLLLATGGRARGLPGTRGLPGVHQLRTLADARRLRAALTGGGPVLVVGGGLIGLEVAAAARGAGCEVTVAETAARPLRRVLPPRIADAVTALHRSRGVDVRTGVRLVRFAAAGDTVVARDDRGAALVARTVLVAVGMAPRSALAERAGLAVDDGIVVDAYCATSAPGV